MPLTSRLSSRVVALLAFALAACQSSDLQEGLAPATSTASETIQGLTLSPTAATLAPGQQVTFTPLGWLASGGDPVIASVTWTATGGTISSTGVYTAGNVAGTYQVKAQSTDTWNYEIAPITINTPAISVTSVTLSPASVSLATGATKQFATAVTMSDGTTSATEPVTWTATGGTVSSNGLYTAGNTAGSYRVIAATSNGKADTSAVSITTATISSISLTPASASVPVGTTRQFSVSATLSNGTTQSSPAGITWTATGGTISATGLYTGGKVLGTYQVIAASSNGKKDTSVVKVTNPVITSVSLTPATVSLAPGATQQFSVYALFSNGGNQTMPNGLTWSATGGTVSTGGLYTAGSTAGTYRVIVSSSNGKKDTSAVTITAPAAPTMTGIVVTPGTSALATGGTQQFAAASRWSDGTTSSGAAVTWSATGGTVSAGGLYTAGSTAGSYRVIAVQSGGTMADTSAITVTAPVPGGTLYPNKPSGYTHSSELDFSQAIPSLPDNVDRPIPGAPAGWNMIYFGSSWSQRSDATAPQSAPGVWNGHWDAGSYGGGVIGQGSGHGIGNVFTYAAMGTPRLYMSMRVYFDFDPSQWHPISNKFVNIEGNNSLLLVQLNEGGNWRHAEELGYSGASFWVDNGASYPGEPHLPGQLSNPAIPTRKWVQLEVLIDLPNHVFKIWQDGVLTTSATPNFNSTVMNTVSWNAFRGGGGETLSSSLDWRYDDFYIAW